MAHYFENDPNVKDEPKTITFTFENEKFSLESNAGVFSSDKLDTGTEILLETVLENSSPCSHVLDLGCGIGTVGVILSRFWDCQVMAIDVNERACHLAKINFEKNKVNGEVVCQDGLEEQPADLKFDCILLNPPIRAGKEVIYRLFEQALDHLDPNGFLWIVIRKQHGAKSAVAFLESKKAKVERVNRDKGFWVLKVSKSQPGI